MPEVYALDAVKAMLMSRFLLVIEETKTKTSQNSHENTFLPGALSEG